MKNLFIEKTMTSETKRNNSLPAFRLSSGDVTKSQFNPGLYITNNSQRRNSFGEGLEGWKGES